MRRTGAFQFGLPRFQGAVRQIILCSLGVWITVLLLTAFDKPDAAWLLRFSTLDPGYVLRGWAWLFLTYGFVHVGPGHLFLTMLGIYFIGSSVEERIGKRAFWELYLWSLVSAGVVGFLLSLTGYVGFGPTVGAGPAANAILMVFYLFYRGASIYLFPFPFQIPVKWVVIIFAAIETGYFLLYHFPLIYLVNLLGLGVGYLWYRFLWRRASVSAIVQLQALGLRNAYYRWKRRRTAKKFQVYMRKHQDDPKQYFDEYGNFRPPDEREKKDGEKGKGGWVN